jgi:glycosyltransferase involved in cell wall biosynthesis
MNICLITGSYLPAVGGRELVVHNLATSLADMGHNVIVFVQFRKDRKKQNDYNYRIVQYGFRGSGRLKLSKACKYIMLLYVAWRHKIDVINIHGVFQSETWTFQFLKKILKIPIIGTPHGDDIQILPELNYGIRLDPKKDMVVQRNVKSCNRLTAISRSIRNSLKDILEDDQDIRDVPNGIWTSTFQRKINKDETRRRYGIPVNCTLLVSVGRNHPKKGFEIGVEALSKLKKKNINIAYLIIGRDMNIIREKAKSLGVSDILFTPGQLREKEVADLFQASDIYVSPSLIESFGITTIEAMSAGLPCVVSDIEGSRDIVSSKFGVLVEPGDAKELSDTIRRLLKNRTYLEKMGEEARIESKKYDWSIIVKMYEEVYQEVVLHKN